MKKYSSLLVCGVALLMSVTSCEPETKVEVVFPQEKDSQKIAEESIVATYMGVENECGLFAFEFLTEEGDAGLHLELYSDSVAGKDLLDANLAAGWYKVGEDAKPFAIKASKEEGEGLAGSYYFTKDAEGVITKRALSGGQVFVSVSDDGDAAIVSKVAVEGDTSGLVAFDYNGKIDIEPVYNTVFDTQVGWYWGDDEYEYPNIGQYMVTLYAGKYNSEGIVDGMSVSLSYYAEMAEKAWEAKIPEGRYVGSTEYGKGVILVATPEQIEENPWSIYGYAMRTEAANGEKVNTFAVEIDSKVKQLDNGEYVLKFNMLLNTGERYVAKYAGKIKQGDEFTRSKLTGDVAMEPGYGYVEYVGKSYIRDGVNRWNIRLFADELVVHPEEYWGVELKGSGDYIIIEVFTDSHYTTEIPDGKYVISTEESPYHVGMGTGGWGFNMGTWYYSINGGKEDKEAPAKSGELVLKKSGEAYELTYSFVDDRGYKIAGSYNGALTYYTEPAASYVSRYNWESVPANSYQAAQTNRLNRIGKAHGLR